MPAVAGGPLWFSGVAVAVHPLATLTGTWLVAVVVYDWVGLALLRRGWINFDLLWTAALIVTGVALIVTA